MGQPDYSSISSVMSGSDIYFTAYSDSSGKGIWKTNLNETIAIKVFPADRFPFLRLIHGNWLIYTINLDNISDACIARALNVETLEDIEIPLELDCINILQWENAKYTGKYLVTLVGGKFSYLLLDALPQVNIVNLTAPQDLHEIAAVIDTHLVLAKHKIPFSDGETYYLADLDLNTRFNFSNRVPAPLSQVNRLIKDGSKYYFQTNTSDYRTYKLFECNEDFNISSFRQVMQTNGNLLHVENGIGYIADFDGTYNVMDQYQLANGQRIKRTLSPLKMDYINWEEMLKADENGFILKTYAESICYYNTATDTIVSLKINEPLDLAMPVLALDSGVFIRYRDNSVIEKLLYFPYSDLKPSEILNTVVNGPFETKILHALPNNKLFALVNDPIAGAEYVVIDVVNGTYDIIKDINKASIRDKAAITRMEVLSDQRLLLGITNATGSEVHVFDPITRKAMPIYNYSDEKESIYFIGTSNNFNYVFIDAGLLQNATSNDSVIYFSATKSNIFQSYLYAFLINENKLIRVCPNNYNDRLLMVNGQLIIIRTFDEFYAPIKREIHYLNGNSLEKVFVSQNSQSYSFVELEHYFTHKGKLYFSSDEKLYVMDVATKEISLLVNNFARTPQYDPVLFEHFMVINDEVYFAETRKRPDYVIHFFYGFNKDLEQTLWKTDGTALGTTEIVYSDFYSTSFYYANAGIFKQGTEIYMSMQMEGDDYFRLYRLRNNQWEPTQLRINGILTDKSPAFKTQKLYKDYPEIGYAQNVKGYDVPTSILIGEANKMEGSLNENLTCYAFKHAEIPELFVSDGIQVGSNSGFINTPIEPIQIGDKLYFLNGYSTGQPSLKEFSLKNYSSSELLPDTSFLEGVNFFMVADKEANKGYVVLGEADYYGASTLWTFNVCATSSDEITISPLNDSICQGDQLQVAFNLPEFAEQVYFKINGERALFNTEIDTNSGKANIQIWASEGSYNFSYWRLDNCEEVLIAEHPLNIIGNKPKAQISVSAGLTPQQKIYKADGGTYSSYEWTVIGSSIFVGQGTSSITVDWGTAAEGNVSLKVSNKDCTDTTSVLYSIITGFNNNTLLTAHLYPNPATQKVHIGFDDIRGEVFYNLLNVSGQTLSSGKFIDQFNTLDISGVEPGMYILQLNDGVRVAGIQLVVIQ